MDDTDKILLNLLQNNAKLTAKQLSMELHLSVTAVFERVKKLEKNGFIDKYVALLDKAKVKKDFLVLCHIKLDQHRKEYITQFEKEIVLFPEILECFHVSGDYDYIVKICVQDIKEYREFMVTKLTSLKHIASTQSSFSIKVVKNETGIIL